jgi:hypothetical protein
MGNTHTGLYMAGEKTHTNTNVAIAEIQGNPKWGKQKVCVFHHL